jgi:hypothetical protein
VQFGNCVTATNTAAALISNLHAFPGSLRSLNHPLSFLGIVASWFLYIDMFACVASKDRCWAMPMIWRSAKESIDLLIIQHASDIDLPSSLAPGFGDSTYSGLPTQPICLANRFDLNSGNL